MINKDEMFIFDEILQKNQEIERLQKLLGIEKNKRKQFDKDNRKLYSIIKEAIEYIEERYNGEVLTHTFDKDNVGELLNILNILNKGE